MRAELTIVDTTPSQNHVHTALLQLPLLKLRLLAEQRGLKKSGNKADLISRLRCVAQPGLADDAAAELSQLVAEGTRVGIPYGGKRLTQAELRSRLRALSVPLPSADLTWLGPPDASTLPEQPKQPFFPGQKSRLADASFLNDLTVAQLQIVAEGRGLKKSGNKADVVARLLTVAERHLAEDAMIDRHALIAEGWRIGIPYGGSRLTEAELRRRLFALAQPLTVFTANALAAFGSPMAPTKQQSGASQSCESASGATRQVRRSSGSTHGQVAPCHQPGTGDRSNQHCTDHLEIADSSAWCNAAHVDLVSRRARQHASLPQG